MAKEKQSTRTVTVRIPTELYEHIETLAEATTRTVAHQMVHMLRQAAAYREMALSELSEDETEWQKAFRRALARITFGEVPPTALYLERREKKEEDRGSDTE